MEEGTGEEVSRFAGPYRYLHPSVFTEDPKDGGFEWGERARSHRTAILRASLPPSSCQPGLLEARRNIPLSSPQPTHCKIRGLREGPTKSRL